MTETTTTDFAVEPSTQPTGGTMPAGLVVRYRYADGILVEGKTYPHRNEVKKAQPRWRWCGSLRRWVVPRTRERMLSSDQVEEYAEGLRAAGVPNVRVDYQEPRPGDVLDVDQAGEVVEALEGRDLDRTGHLDEATPWLDRMNPITARHFVRWLPTSYRNATGILDAYRSRYGVELAQPQPQPHGPGPSAARRVLEDVFGIDFDAEDEDGAISPRCDDGTEPEILGERAAKRAAAQRARREHERAFRQLDARALMKVGREAASRGEVTKGRFNTAYRRLHPAFERAARRQRALVLTHQGRRIEATVRGPKGVEFSVSLPADADERAVIAALLRRIEMAARAAGTGRPTARAETAPRAARGPKVDVEALSKEDAIGTTATTASAASDAISAVMREIEQVASRFIGTLEHEATETTIGPEDEKDTDSIEEGPQADVPATTKEGSADQHSTGNALAPPEPWGKAALGSLGKVEHERFALLTPPGMATCVHAPTGHQPPLFDVSERDPAMLVRTRAAGRLVVAVGRRALWATRIRGPPRPRQRYAEVTASADTMRRPARATSPHTDRSPNSGESHPHRWS